MRGLFPLRLSIRMRLFAGFGLVLALLAGLATLGILTFSRTSEALNTLIQTAGETQRALVIDRDIMSMRRDATRYLDRGEEKVLTKYHEAETALGDKIAQALAEESVPEDRAELEELHGGFEEYKLQYAKTVELRQAREAIVVKKMDLLATEIGDKLGSVSGDAIAKRNFETATRAALVKQEFLAGRIEAMRFVAYNDPAMAEAARNFLNASNEEMDRFLSSMADAAVVTDAMEIKWLLEEYASGFADLVRAVGAMEVVRSGPMAKAAENLTAIAAKIRQQHVDLSTQMMREVDTEVGSASTVMMVIAGAAMVIGLLLAYLVGRSISRRLRMMTGTMAALAGGDRTVEVPATGDQDEIGAMARALEVFKSQANEVAKLQAEQVAARSEAERERRRTTAGLADRFQAGVGTVVESVGTSARQMEETARAMASAADEANGRSASGLAAAGLASANVQTVAAAAQQLSASVTEISRQVAEAASISREASGEAERTNDRVREFAEAAARIDQVIGLINEIASRTNLLALNATIEAARAGEAGKGFAVVASEVKNLAKQTADATEEISRQIAGVQSASGEMVSAIGGISSTIIRVTEIASTIAAAVEQQGAATEEIARNAQEAAAGTSEVTETIGCITRAAEESGAAASRVLATATALGRSSGDLRAEVDRFVGNIRAA